MTDNPALLAAVERGEPVIPVFIWSPEEEAGWAPGAASRRWLSGSLTALDQSLRQRGARLILCRGTAAHALLHLAAETGATAVHWNRRYDPSGLAVERDVTAALRQAGVTASAWRDSLLFDPDDVRTGAGTPYKVYTPFHRACRLLPQPARPKAAPAYLPAPNTWPVSVYLGMDAAGAAAGWAPGEASALAQLERFVDETVEGYSDLRDLPDREGTSRLSPHLCWGEVGIRQVWHAVHQQVLTQPAAARGSEVYLRELLWREFAHHLLYHFPQTCTQPLRPEFAAFPWAGEAEDLAAWQEGRTGYPLVDAGMRQLRQTGWMHNRVRMVVASFLVKHLLLPWQQGAAWFWDALADADLANNSFGWQWAAGCGADAAPYFRIFNPVIQGEKFDSRGNYVRRWVPELAQVPDRWVHRPWEAPAGSLEQSGVKLGQTYPAPVIDHHFARHRALAALATVKGASAPATDSLALPRR